MELSALSPSPSPFLPYPLSPSFSDPSHVQFYGCPFRPASSPLRIKRAFVPLAPFRPARLSRAPPGSCGTCPLVPLNEPAVEQDGDLLRELADLKALMKQKKKQLKAQMKAQAKDRKEALKAEKKKETKAKDCSSSSSSSESSDCESVDMKVLREVQTEPRVAEGAVEVIDAVIEEVPLQKSSGDCSDAGQAVASVADGTPLPSVLCPSKKIEVCVGGKCKKAGSEQLLASLRGQIKGDSGVEAGPCKCMGKCAMGINVRVQKEETNPQHHSHVGIGDAALLLSHHFGLGPPPSGLPSFSHKASPSLTPQRLVTSS